MSFGEFMASVAGSATAQIPTFLLAYFMGRAVGKGIEQDKQKADKHERE